MENIERHMRITRFLLEVNKLMDGVHIDETTENHLHPHVKFEANLTCIYASPVMWSPSAAFFKIIGEASKKFFGLDDYNMFGWNNTNTIFWIDKEKIK